MKRNVDAQALEEAERLINGPLPLFSELPDVSVLDESLRLLEEDEAHSIRHRSPPPLWTEVGNEVCKKYRDDHPDHPMSNDDRARERRRAASLVLSFAATDPSSFTRPRMEVLNRCLFDCDVSVRHDLVKAVAKIGGKASAEALEELMRIEPESEMVLSMATLVYKRLKR